LRECFPSFGGWSIGSQLLCSPCWVVLFAFVGIVSCLHWYSGRILRCQCLGGRVGHQGSDVLLLFWLIQCLWGVGPSGWCWSWG
jgi:hypothetical protein